MVTKKVIVKNSLGLHMRPSGFIVRTANRYTSSVTIAADDKKANAKSIMEMMMMQIAKGTEVTITADGDDEAEVLAEIVALFESGFDENDDEMA